MGEERAGERAGEEEKQAVTMHSGLHHPNYLKCTPGGI